MVSHADSYARPQQMKNLLRAGREDSVGAYEAFRLRSLDATRDYFSVMFKFCLRLRLAKSEIFR